ncbi:MAG: hypothetical protein A2W26_00105 [Acidobacteria bacterium RBG_16_64_8]|nr:MAG: hypothetical protein A2W26_00105 [Acidobacteria bacterium RBG_16_64_8]
MRASKNMSVGAKFRYQAVCQARNKAFDQLRLARSQGVDDTEINAACTAWNAEALAAAENLLSTERAHRKHKRMAKKKSAEPAVKAPCT